MTLLQNYTTDSTTSNGWFTYNNAKSITTLGNVVMENIKCAATGDDLDYKLIVKCRVSVNNDDGYTCDWPISFVKYGQTWAAHTNDYKFYRQLDGWACETEYWCSPAPNPRQRLLELLHARQAPAIFVRKPPEPATDVREIRARETLRLCLGEDLFRSFLRHGFISVRAKSGLVYQIFPGHGITRVYRHGVQVERLCVVFKGDFPPADSLIMRFLLILNDEEEFRQHAIVHGVYKESPAQQQLDLRPLPEIFRELKKQVAA